MLHSVFAAANDDELKREIEFEEKLRALMAEYGVNLQGLIALLDPQSRAKVSALGSSARGNRRQRQLKIYKNPETGEVVETKGGNNKVLKSWKVKYGAEKVQSWLQ
ncbi:hypothetical protein PA6567_01177 [Pseudomonas aeruginosa]